jgi:hypothetical protein
MMASYEEPVGPAPSGPDRTHYIVGATDPHLLETVAARIPAIAGVEVVRTLRGAAGISAIVVDSGQAGIQQLRQEFGSAELVIEPDLEWDQYFGS